MMKILESQPLNQRGYLNEGKCGPVYRETSQPVKEIISGE
jgi:hypothetical protein